MTDNHVQRKKLEDNNEEDIVAITESFGIFHPLHHHSFAYVTWKLSLPLCDVCQAYLHPFISYVYCIRCQIYVHRGCCKEVKKCSQFSLMFPQSPESPVSPVKSLESSVLPTVSQESPMSVIHVKVSETHPEPNQVLMQQLDTIIATLSNIPSVLGYIPNVHSHYCLWKSSLSYIASFPQHHHVTTNSTFAAMLQSLESMESLEVPCLEAYIHNIQSFTGQVTYLCITLFLSLTFQSLEELFQHIRACIDTITYAIFLQEDMTSIPIDVFHQLTSKVEGIILAYHDNAIYDKIYQAIQVVSNMLLLKFSRENNLDKKTKRKKNAKVDQVVQELVKSVNPLTKLNHLVTLLQVLSKQIPEGEDGADEGWSQMIDTDELIHRFVQLLRQYLLEESSERVDWLAESLFLSSSFVKTSLQASQENGALNYSLVTLQQCLQITFDPRTLSNSTT